MESRQKYFNNKSIHKSIYIQKYIYRLFNVNKKKWRPEHIYRLFNVNKKKWRPMGHFPNQPKMANYARSITRGERMASWSTNWSIF